MENRIVECFLCGTDSTRSLIHGIRVIDAVHQEENLIHVCDGDYKTVCENNDVRAAEMWAGMKQAQSSGYNDASFIQLLSETLTKKFDAKLHALYLGPTFVPYLVACTPPLMPGAASFGLWCRSSKPIPPRLADKASTMVGSLYIEENLDGWIDQRFLIASQPDLMNDTFEDASLDVARSLIVLADQKYPGLDLFLLLAHSQVHSGYELMRRLLL